MGRESRRSCVNASSSRLSAAKRPAWAWGCPSVVAWSRTTAAAFRGTTRREGGRCSSFLCPRRNAFRWAASLRRALERKAMPTLLIVDDEPSILFAFRKAFRDPALDVRTAGSVAEALEAARQSRPDVVLLDVQLPDGSGLEALQKLREIDARCPII